MSDSGETSGTRLKAERERRGLSTQKAADELRLDVWVIDALETGEYERIGPSVYAKGHLKKYASMLGLPPAEILAGYEEASVPKAPASAPATVRLSTADFAVANLPWPRIAAFAAGALLFIGILLWRPWQHRAAGKPAVSAQSIPKAHPAPPAPTPSAARPATPPVTPHNPVPAAPAAARESVPAPSPAASAAAPAAAVPATSAHANAQTASAAGVGHARLRLSFSADSWVVVRDAAGKRVFAGYGRANSVKTIAGSAPLQVYLGFASGVQLEINQRVVAIGPQFVAGEVARFEAGADGVLRRDSHTVPAHDLRPHR
jgi:cytoskeleton protein RodZ